MAKVVQTGAWRKFPISHEVNQITPPSVVQRSSITATVVQSVILPLTSLLLLLDCYEMGVLHMLTCSRYCCNSSNGKFYIMFENVGLVSIGVFLLILLMTGTKRRDQIITLYSANVL